MLRFAAKQRMSSGANLARFRSGEEEFALSGRAPAVDSYEKGENIVIKAEVPGVEKDDITVEVQDDTLCLRGKRRRETDLKEESYNRMERSYGSFKRLFSLPESVDKDKVRASFKNGLFEIVLPKIGKEKSKQIKVDVK